MADEPKKPSPWVPMAVTFAVAFAVPLLLGSTTRIASIDSDTTSIRFKVVQMQIQLDRIERVLSDLERSASNDDRN